MIGEDHRSQAVLSFRRLLKMEASLGDAQDGLDSATKALQEKSEQLNDMLKFVNDCQMETEDHVCQIFYKNEEIVKLRQAASEHADEVRTLSE